MQDTEEDIGLNECYVCWEPYDASAEAMLTCQVCVAVGAVHSRCCRNVSCPQCGMRMDQLRRSKRKKSDGPKQGRKKARDRGQKDAAGIKP